MIGSCERALCWLRVSAVTGLVGLGGCAGCEGSRAGSEAVSVPPQGQPPQTEERTPATKVPTPPAGLRLLAEDRQDQVQLMIRNHGPGDVSVSSELTWVSLDGTPLTDTAALSVAADCAVQPPACVPLTTGAELLPHPLRTRPGLGQCAGTGKPAPANGVRVRLRGCGDPAFEVLSEPIKVQP